MKSLVAIVSAIALGASLLAPAAPASADATISVSLTDYAVTPSASSAAPGTITFNVSNDAPIIHDFHVIQTNLAPGSLPVDPNLAQVDLTQVNEVASTSTIQPGASDSTAPDLSAASYVLICNLPGHYEAGMYTGFTVAQAPAATNTPPDNNNGGPTPSDGSGTPVPGGTDDGGTGGAVDSPPTGYGPDRTDSPNSWLYALPLAGLTLAFGLAALRRSRAR
jgi:uncharacterized cupredoxin-like copper-binding protein